VIGYQEGKELTEDRVRKEHGLEPRARMATSTIRPGARPNYISNYGDWIASNATLSTAPDQIAIAPGYLAARMDENGRRYFHYRMDVPILNFYSFLSAATQ